MTDKPLTEIRKEDETGIMLYTAYGILMVSKIKQHIIFWSVDGSAYDNGVRIL